MSDDRRFYLHDRHSNARSDVDLLSYPYKTIAKFILHSIAVFPLTRPTLNFYDDL